MTQEAVRNPKGVVLRDEINTPVTAKRLKTILETFPKSAKQDVAQGFSYGLEMVAEAPRTITISRKHFGSQSGELGVTPRAQGGARQSCPSPGTSGWMCEE